MDHRKEIVKLTQKIDKLKHKITEHKEVLLASKDPDIEVQVRAQLLRSIKSNLESCKTISTFMDIVTSNNILISLVEKSNEIAMFTCLLLAIRNEGFNNAMTNVEYEEAATKILELI